MSARNSTEVDRHLGERLAARRVALGLTRHQVASAAGVSVQQLAKYEMGANRISASRLVLLAESLSLSPAALLPPSGTSSAAEADGDAFDRLTARIADPAVRAALIGLAAVLAA
ncbi:MAG TPA: helix-turn-helix transcriptional regulator [Brevundimonas sp.]|jgi:transcriptional regulator with XRE-family HTH domain|uniref:helix-turn-helix domain-containing protein n=1 Tax=Brevundimonas sp. TaxID=1871086 RepID=UPI002DEEAF5B|nr:helix-turn-helix transcriptional regulator [Brevundimonas sp.]